MKKLLVFCVLFLIVTSCRNSFPVTQDQLRVEPTTTMIERGRVLTLSACGPCHLNGSTNTLIGERMYDMRRILGRFYSSNLTNDSLHGIAAYSDAQLAHLVKTGVTNKGRFIPFMLRPNIADADMHAIIAFLRSGQPEVLAKDTTVGRTKYSLIGRIGFALVNNKPLPFNEGIARPEKSDSVQSGKYLVDILGCYHCHSSNITRINYLHPEATKGYMEGGFTMRAPDGERFEASNLTPDTVNGIGSYTASEFNRAVKQGIGKNNRILRYPMRLYPDLPDEEVQAIYSYLSTLQPVRTKTRK